MLNQKKLKLISLTVAVIGLFLSSVTAQTADENTLRQKLQARLDEWHKNGKFAGAALGFCSAEGKCFGLATGYSDLEQKTQMKPDDLMLAGSVGKTFAAVLALQLVKEGKINLDDKIEKYLGAETWFSRLPNARDITVRQLMTHSSGLVRYEFNPKFLQDLRADPDRVWKPEELIAYLFDQKAPFEAGKDWDYSDTNYIVLGMIIEKVTGKKYYDLAVKRILEPLKLNRTKPQDRRELKGLIQGYAGEGNDFTGKDRVLENGKFTVNPQFEWTGGGMVSNAEDLARWAKLMYEGKAFDASLVPEMLNGVPAKLGRDSKYGLGVIIRKSQSGVLSYGHSGFFPGYLTEMMYFPEHKISLAVQVNTSVPQNLGKPMGRVLLEALDTILGKEPAPVQPASASATQPKKQQFVIVLRLQPKYQDDKNWTEADNQAVGRHFAKLQQLQKEGKLILAGRTLVKESMGFVILEAESEAEARRVMENDDAVQAGIMSAEVLPFQTALLKVN
jgi:D-alanyl-D-alanine carboxypeptidase